MSNKLLHVYPQKCIACKNCELACAQVHAVNGKWGKSRIAAVMDTTPAAKHTVVVCIQCADAACVSACPAKALVRDDSTGAIVVDRAKCVKCKSCVAACPFGNMHWECSHRQPVKCDLCDGDPACAKFCPTGALLWK